MIQALIFDLGDVIVGLDFDRAYRAVGRLTGLAKPAIQEKIVRADLAVRYETGEISSAEFHEQFCEAVGLHLSYEEFAQLWGNMFAEEPLLEEELFAHWADHYRLVLLSNTNELHFRWIEERYAPLAHFHQKVLSYEVGVMKPFASIYEAAVKAADVPPAACFFTDDKTINIAGAQAAGLQAEQFTGRAELLSQLGARGVSLP